jgi:hypothetical protein
VALTAAVAAVDAEVVEAPVVVRVTAAAGPALRKKGYVALSIHHN